MTSSKICWYMKHISIYIGIEYYVYFVFFFFLNPFIQYKKLCVFRLTWNSSRNQSLYLHTTKWMNKNSLSNPKLLRFDIINNFRAHSIYPKKNCVYPAQTDFRMCSDSEEIYEELERKSWSFFETCTREAYFSLICFNGTSASVWSFGASMNLVPFS